MDSKRNINLFNKVLFRIASESFSSFNSQSKVYLNLSESLSKLIDHEHEKDILKADISDLLFDQIRIQETESLRKEIINFRREVHNEKKRCISTFTKLEN